jgi:hypothetical protein
VIVAPPRRSRLDAVCLTGWTRPTLADTPVLSGVVVVKAAYRLVATGAGPRRTEPVATAVAFADEQVIRDLEGTVVGFEPVREADTALEKERTDVVVEGHVAGFSGGTVRVDGEDWMVRDGPGVTSPDTARNLFGWLARGEEPRAVGDEDTALLPGSNLPETYHAGINNVHRRGGPFRTPGDRNRAPLPSGATVEIFTTPGPTGDAYAFTLPDLTLSARLRAYCGHGSDEAPYWRIVATLPLVPDTLVVAPDEDRATVLWRARWDHALQPADRWRAVQILAGGG